MNHLAAALRALGDRSGRAGQADRAGALEHLVRAWRAHERPPAIAALVEALSTEISRALEPIDPTLGDADFHAAWIARASRAELVDLDVLLPGLFRGPLGKRIRARFELILPFADDPRVTAAFGRMIDEPPVMAASNFPMWTQLYAALHRAPDLRLRELLERRMASSTGDSQFWPMLAQRSLALLRELPERPPQLAPERCQQIAALRERIAELAAAAPVARLEAGEPGIEDELLAQIYAEPAALDRRMVWADALLSRGDPRGEFVQLQLARRADDGSGGRPSKRERQLLARHELTWLGELAAVVDRRRLRWADGFPVAAEVVFDSRTQRALIESEAWATFEELDCDDLELICAPVMRALRRVGGLKPATLQALAESRGPALGVEILGPIALEQNPPAELRRLHSAPAERLSEVRELRIHLRNYTLSKDPHDLEWLFASPLGRRLTSFRLSGIAASRHDVPAVPWAEWLVAHTRWPGLERVRLDLGVLSVEFCARTLRVRTRLEGAPIDYYQRQAREQMAALRGRFDRLELLSCGQKLLAERTAARWAEAAGFTEFDHLHVPAPSGEPVSGIETARTLDKLAAKQRKAQSRIARAARQTQNQPPPPRRYGPGLTGPWLIFDEHPSARPRLLWGSAVAFSPAGDELLVIAGQLAGLSLPKLELRWILRADNRSSISSFAVEPRDRRLWLGTRKGETVLWDLQARRELARARFHVKGVGAVAIAGQRMFSADLDRKLLSWRLPDPLPDSPPMLVPEQTLSLDPGNLALALDPAGASLAVLAGGRLELLDLDQLERRRTIGRVPTRTRLLAWSPDGDHLLAGCVDGTIQLWDPDGRPLLALRVHDRELGGLAWTPDGTRLITVGADDSGPSVKVIDRHSGEILVRIQPARGGVNARVAVSPDGRLLALSAFDWIGCWRVEDGAEVGVWG